MGDNIYLGDRNGLRTPMQWTSDGQRLILPQADPAKFYLPLYHGPDHGYRGGQRRGTIWRSSLVPAQLDQAPHRCAQGHIAPSAGDR